MRITLKIVFGISFLVCFFIAGFSSNAQTEFWGVTANGGIPNKGCIFRTDNNGNNQQVAFEFPYLSPSGQKYSQVVEAPSGKLYFVTPNGGTYDGTIMEYDPATGALDTVYNFQPSPELRSPYGKMYLASNGKFYGVTYAGGSPASIEPGGVYEFDPATRTYAFKISFDYSNAYRSYSSFVEEPGTGKLYTTTYYGGTVQKGSLIEYDINTNTFVKKVQFDGASNGAFPIGELFKASNGKYYGMTTEGGLYNKGVLYEYDLASNTLTNRMDFDSITNGSRPYGGFIEPVTGMLYGMTSSGGSSNYGVVFKYNINTSVYTKIYEFSLSMNGYMPYGTLIKAADGFLYGNTFSGPTTNANGTLFRIDTSNDSLTNFYIFNYRTMGSQSTGSLMQASNGKLYGLTSYGTAYLQGSFYSYDLSNSVFTRICQFKSAPLGNWGLGGLIQANNGLLYGVGNKGGDNNTGVIYSINPFTLDYDVLFNFDSEFSNLSGRWPQARLCQSAMNGKLYGVCSNGGSGNKGTMYSYDTGTGFYHMIHECYLPIDGQFPKWHITEAGNGKLYGVMQASSPSYGVVYEIDPATENYQQRLDFSGFGLVTPNGGLTRTATGRLFGVALISGAPDSGIVYEYDYSSNTLSTIASFAGGANGKSPLGSMIEASNGKLYGYAAGGFNNKGIIFECDIVSQSVSKAYDFDSTSGTLAPDGSLMQASNGKLYGVTVNGGDSLAGTIFEFDVSNYAFTEKFQFNKLNGNGLSGLKLLEVSPTASVNDLKNPEKYLKVSPSVSTGRYEVNTCGNILISSLKITDVAGKEVFRSEDGGARVHLNISHLSTGIYFVHAILNSREEVVRIVKE